MSNLIVPVLICAILLHGACHKVDVFQTFLEGAREGVSISLQVLPALVALMTCVGMFNASGALDLAAYALRPLADLAGIPREIVPLAVLRPISGGGSLVFCRSLLEQFGPDSYIGRVAGVLEAAGETTFYTVAVYYGATRVTHTRHTLPAALLADVVGVVVSAAVVRAVFGSAL